jgi:hypothetical protein
MPSQDSTASAKRSGGNIGAGTITSANIAAAAHNLAFVNLELDIFLDGEPQRFWHQ